LADLHLLILYYILRYSIAIPSSATKFCEYCFCRCRPLSTVVLYNGSRLSCVEADVFHDCPSLSSIWIPSWLQYTPRVSRLSGNQRMPTSRMWITSLSKQLTLLHSLFSPSNRRPGDLANVLPGSSVAITLTMPHDSFGLVQYLGLLMNTGYGRRRACCEQTIFATLYPESIGARCRLPSNIETFRLMNA
jgi:hypothetical protein